MSRPGGLRMALLGLVAAVLPLLVTAPAAAAPGDFPGVLKVRTVPATQGARVAADGNIVTANARGRARLPVPRFTGLSDRFHVLSTRVSPTRRVSLDRVVGRPEHGVSGAPVVVGLRTERLVKWRFRDRLGNAVPISDVEFMELKSSTGEILRLKGHRLNRPTWLASGRTQQSPQGLISKDLYWSITRVVVNGADVVNRGQQLYFPEKQHNWTIQLLFYRVSFAGRDLLFGTNVGKGVEVVYPDGRVVRAPFVDGNATVPQLPRGQYDVHVYGSGVSFTQPMSVSKDQAVEIAVISGLDTGLITGTLVLVAVSLVAVGRRRQIARLHSRMQRRRHLRRLARSTTLLTLVVALSLAIDPAPVARAEPAPASAVPRTASVDQDRPPTFAYYYIWYEPNSWRRAKTDYPLLGKYLSDDPAIMRQHVRMAKAAGLTGFLVSWKDLAPLTSRLDRLVRIADEMDFKLGIVYQGLDFNRQPVDTSIISQDLSTFIERYADDPAFDYFGKPVVIITGTEAYTTAQLKLATTGTRKKLRVLGSAKNADEYRRIARYVDGDAYYWSSANPRSVWYGEHLNSVAAAVRADNGLWLAPASAGFDARLLGGQQVIAREGGETLKAAIAAAVASRPDAVAVISWNEFSENSHIEPSVKYGVQELQALAQVLDGRVIAPKKPATEQEPRSVRTGLTGWGALFAILLLVAVLNFLLVLRRRDNEGRRAPPKQPKDPPRVRTPSTSITRPHH